MSIELESYKNEVVMRRRDILKFGLGALMTCGVVACKSAGPTVPEPASLPAGVGSLSGVWYSPQFEQMYIRQIGDEVRGIYTYKYGGTFEGKIVGNLIKFKWIDPGDPDVARRTFKGEGYWQVVKEGDRIFLKGAWGYNDDVMAGGPWEAEYIRELEDSDPSTVEEYRDNEVR